MKIEKVNERQIRCTLTKNDLTSRNLKMSELAYGTDKAKNLFRDMMREAESRFGFEVEDIPLMIEAIFRKLKEQVQEAEANLTSNDSGDSITASRPLGIPDKGQTKEVKITIQVDLTKLYSFAGLDDVIRAAKILKGVYNGENALYKDPEAGKYYLVIRKSELTPETFNKVCNIITEYGHMEECTTAAEGRIREHYEVIVAEHALEKLALI